MVLFYLTNSLLDISAGILWWVGTKTASLIYNGVSYAIYGNSETEEISENYDALTKDDIIELKELKEEIKGLKSLLVQKENNK